MQQLSPYIFVKNEQSAINLNYSKQEKTHSSLNVLQVLKVVQNIDFAVVNNLPDLLCLIKYTIKYMYN